MGSCNLGVLLLMPSIRDSSNLEYIERHTFVTVARKDLRDRMSSLSLDIASKIFSVVNKKSLPFSFNKIYLVDSALRPTGSIAATLQNSRL